MEAIMSDRVERLQAKIAEAVGPQRFKIWFKNATRFYLDETFLKIGVPNMFIGGWIESHFSDTIVKCAQEVAGHDVTLTFAIEPALSKNQKQSQLDSQVTFMNKNPEREARAQRRNGAWKESKTLRGTLENFVVGSSNQLAYTCVRSVIHNPARQYNPLFLHGGCGLGKTHLLQSIYNGIREAHPQFQCIYLTGEEFTNHFVFAVKSGNRDAFRHRFRSADVLLIDDVHFLANKKATQEEFLHTFNSVDSVGKQVVMASDSHPKLIGNFSESLVSRFVAGMVVKVEPPGKEERIEILQRHCLRMGKHIPGPVLEYVANCIDTNVRELEGSILKLLAFSNMTHQPITLALAQRALQDHFTKAAPIVKLSDIESVVAIYFGLTPADLHTSRKTRTIALARGIAMWIARNHTTMSFPEIGKLMGNKNHSTVILACAKLNRILDADGTVRWVTPSGERESTLGPIIKELEAQLNLGGSAPQEPEQLIDEVVQPASTKVFPKAYSAGYVTV